MTLNELIQVATRMSYNLSGGDIPILLNGKEVDISLMLSDSNTPMVEMNINFLAKETPQDWISVKDRLPEETGFYFTCVNFQGAPQCVGVTYFDATRRGGEWIEEDEDNCIADVDYWMPIPKLKEE